MQQAGANETLYRHVVHISQTGGVPLTAFSSIARVASFLGIVGTNTSSVLWPATTAAAGFRMKDVPSVSPSPAGASCSCTQVGDGHDVSIYKCNYSHSRWQQEVVEHRRVDTAGLA